ncbi:hypothetical protein GCM10009737_14300 [Nocardioides lentus]|uniref:alpha-L-rhamnosidase n=1 Tax=Nocardioides lentus TaxID=338077 RepID=A0ABN2P7E7_9ACTN
MTAARPALRALTRAALTLTLTGSTLAVAAVGASSGSAAVTAPAALAAVAAAGDAPRSLSVNGLPAPVDVDTMPTFGWHLGSAGQTAYELVVSSTAARAAAGDGDVWSSGRVEGDQQSGVAYDGPALVDSERYFWSVRTADTAGDASPWAEPATFGTGTAWADSTPVWAPDPAGSPARDYTLRATVTVDQVALGLRFRAADAQNSYMWQFRADTNRLVPHRQLGGTFTTLGSAVNLPAGTIVAGTPFTVEITAAGTTITTRIDGVQVDQRTDATPVLAAGRVGVRTGLTESGRIDDLSVTAADGEVLLETGFGTGEPTLPCGTVADGALRVPNGTLCLEPVVTDDWALIRGDVDIADTEIAWATLYATAADSRSHKQYVHKTYLNGEFVGLGPTQPIAGETPYDGFDVTEQLRAGENTIGAIAYTTRTQAYAAELVVEYVDGTRETFGTGTDWQARAAGDVWPESGSIGTSYYTAPKENLDARVMPWGFDEPGFDASAWPAAIEKPALPTPTATPTDKVEEQLHDSVRIVEKGPGHYFVDFGRTWIGGVSYDVADGTAGSTVDLRFGEVTVGRPGQSGDTDVRFNLNTGNSYRDVVTLRDGTQRIETWGMRVFRYLEVTGAPEPVTVDNLKALALVYPFDAEASEFAASDRNLEQVYGLSKNSIESLNVNFYTDSWTRERINYEADAYLQLMSTLYLMDDLSLGRYSMNYFRDNRTWPTEWPIYVVLAVHDAWRQTGDLAQPAAYYDNLVDKLPLEWVEESTGLVRKTSRADGCNSQTDCDIVDWPTSERDNFQFRQYNTVINAVSFRAFTDMAAMADALGKDEDAARWSDVATGIRDAMNDRLYDDAAGAYDDGMGPDGQLTGHRSQHASAFSLAFGVPEADQRGRVAEYVGSRGMACSVYCAGLLVPGLYDGGEDQAALDILTSTQRRSWMNMVLLGAGSTAEAWDPSLKSNLTYSHPWAASPAFSIPSGLFGINPTEPGYRSLEIAPQPGDLDWARISTPTVRGSVGTAFDRDAAGDLRLVTSIPGGTSATVRLPAPAGVADSDEVRLYVDGVGRTVTPVDGDLVVAGVSPGCHTFTTDADTDPASDAELTRVCESEPVSGPGVAAEVSEAGLDGWYGAGAALSLDVTGDAPEGSTLEVRVDEGEWAAYDGPVPLADDAGEVAWRLLAPDGGLLADGRMPVRVDSVVPTVEGGVEAGRLWVAGADADSGIAALEWRAAGSTDGWSTWSAPVALPTGVRRVEVRATDLAGNTSAPVAVSAARVTPVIDAAASVRGRQLTVDVRVTARGERPTGRVDFFRGGERVTTRLLDATGRARWVSRAPATPANQQVRVVYRGSDAVAPASQQVRYSVR